MGKRAGLVTRELVGDTFSDVQSCLHIHSKQWIIYFILLCYYKSGKNNEWGIRGWNGCIGWEWIAGEHRE
ncbi:hypothetical protein A4G99_10005 [Haladaptatus sp. R4]|nr:hypothetical protein A4G99_10005 [Haladaptatus sp. R4]